VAVAETVAAPDELRDALFAVASRYTYVKTIGYGGMGVVYEAVDSELEQHVAIKVLRHVQPGEAEKRLARFKREVILSRRIKHPNVAQLYEFGTAGNVPFVTMELVSGRDLGKILESAGRLDPATCVAILRQIALGTQAAHDGGVIHRDLKPQNVMVDDKGLVAILDFGLAIASNQGDLTGEGVILGTPHYMAPEQGRGGQVGPSADLYAIGAIAFHALTGAPPFKGTPIQIVLQHMSARPPAARLIEAGTPGKLIGIVLRCLGKKPEDRFASAAELEQALARLGSLLAAVPGKSTSPALPATPAQSTQRLAPRPIVLVVDDDPDVLRLIASSLAEDGWAALTAPGGGAALQVLDDALVDLVVMDVQMPDVDGFDTTRIIKSQDRWSRLPVILVSSKVDRQRIAFAVQAGATTLIAKPLTPDTIRRAALPFKTAGSATPTPDPRGAV
jgi:serine/threonine-protein kinase